MSEMNEDKFEQETCLLFLDPIYLITLLQLFEIDLGKAVHQGDLRKMRSYLLLLPFNFY